MYHKVLTEGLRHVPHRGHAPRTSASDWPKSMHPYPTGGRWKRGSPCWHGQRPKASSRGRRLVLLPPPPASGPIYYPSRYPPPTLHQLCRSCLLSQNYPAAVWGSVCRCQAPGPCGRGRHLPLVTGLG